MIESTENPLEGTRGRISVRHWPHPDPRYIAVLVHGYGEHIGRYEHVAARLHEHGAVVYGPDHFGHGRSEGEQALIADVDELAADVGLVAERARTTDPGLPLVVIGHSMGGIVATRFAQLHPDDVAILVLSGPAIGGNPEIAAVAEMDPMPEIPIDPAALSRDPAVGEAYASDPLVWHGPFKRETLKALISAIERIADGPTLDAIPILWIHGEEDPIVPLVHTREPVERLAGGGELEEHIYPGARHEIFNETNQDEVIGDVLAFVDARMD